ncbi:hypothetical protein [Jonesia quinghaiensis]|uniref:hypothetical protein n=1 Tax=Jonesia quinghaiensis TaxID=262806 RepID=UPI0004108BFD|nr:hypothetical protein [Jonesia quinghaiensis]
MRKKFLPLFLIVVGVVIAGLGVASGTVWKPDEVVTLTAPSTSEARYVMTAPGVLGQVSDDVTIVARAGGEAEVTLVVARVNDARGWLADTSYQEVSGVASWESLTTRLVEPVEEEPAADGENADGEAAEDAEPADDEQASEDSAEEAEQDTGPALTSSDMWFESVSGAGQVQVQLTSVEDPIVVLAGSDGDAAPELSMTWQREVTTPLLVPGIVGGGVLAVLGLLLLVVVSRPRKSQSVEAVAPSTGRSARSVRSVAPQGAEATAGASRSAARRSGRSAARASAKSATSAAPGQQPAPWDVPTTKTPTAPGSRSADFAPQPQAGAGVSQVSAASSRSMPSATSSMSSHSAPSVASAAGGQRQQFGAPSAAESAMNTAAGISARTGQMPTVGGGQSSPFPGAPQARPVENPRDGSNTGLPYGLTPEAAAMLDTGTLQAIGFTRKELRELTEKQRRPKTSGIPTVPGQQPAGGESWLPRDSQASASSWRAAWGLSHEATPTPDTRMRPGQYSHTDQDAAVVDEALARHQDSAPQQRPTGQPAYTPTPRSEGVGGVPRPSQSPTQAPRQPRQQQQPQQAPQQSPSAQPPATQPGAAPTDHDAPRPGTRRALYQSYREAAAKMDNDKNRQA